MAVLVAAGCSKDETVTSTSTSTAVVSASGTRAPETTQANDDPDEVCDLIEELNETDDNDIDRAGELLGEISDAAPADMEDDWYVLRDAFDQLSALGESDDDIAESLEIVTDPDFIEAADNIDTFAEDECGIDLGLGEDDLDTGGVTDDTVSTGTGTEDDDPTSIDSVQAYLQENYGTEMWWPVIDDATSWGSTGTGDSVEWEIILSSTTTLDAPDAIAACDALADYLDTYEDALEVTVAIKGSDEVVLASRLAGEPCTAG